MAMVISEVSSIILFRGSQTANAPDPTREGQSATGITELDLFERDKETKSCLVIMLGSIFASWALVFSQITLLIFAIEPSGTEHSTDVG